MDNVLSVILGGGQGTRLFPLTASRAKPAVPLLGKYRLIDVPISNCIHSGMRKIFVLTQFNSASLHQHISLTYKFDAFSPGFVQILAAQQTYEDPNWYQGTADAVRQNLRHFDDPRIKYILILSGDQLYHMDFRELVNHHARSRADLTVAVLPVTREDAKGFGVLKVDNQQRIVEFVEKPKQEDVLDRMAVAPGQLLELGLDARRRTHLASMGIYVFNRSILSAALSNPENTDFGREVIPQAIRNRRVSAFVFDGYWEDVGTVEAYYRACLDCTVETPHFEFANPDWEIFTRHRHLPPANIRDCDIHQSLVAEGCRLGGASIRHSVIGIRAAIGAGTRVSDTICMGSDYYERSEERAENLRTGVPDIGIGKDCQIERAIIDKNTRIGDGVRILNPRRIQTFDGNGYYIRDGIVVVPKEAVIPAGSEL